MLSLFTSKSSYHAGQYPVFEVDAVSTASGGRPNKVAELRRGVPAQESLSWNRVASPVGTFKLTR